MRSRLISLILGFLLWGCHRDHPQSMLEPAGPDASSVLTLFWGMTIVFGLVFLIVMIFLGFAFIGSGKKSEAPPLGDTKFIVWGGILIPAVILIGLLFFSLASSMPRPWGKPAVTIEVTGFMWWWDVRYPEEDLRLANELYIPVGKPVLVKLSSADVVHSFWVPHLAGKMDAMPDHPTEIWIQADRPGTYRGQCAEYCGLQHARMAFVVIALPPADYEAWVESRRPRTVSLSEAAERGQQVFFSASCNTCHVVRGTSALGQVGPDLTDLGSRKTLAAATLENNRANLRRWILDPQGVKPGNHMPPTPLEDQDLEDLLDYLESLK